MTLNIVLVEPEIPQNTGNIARTCAATGARLHLVEPMGFRIDDKKLKRAGLDYWQYLDIRYYENFEDFVSKNSGARLIMATTKAKKVYTEINLEEDALREVCRRVVPERLTVWMYLDKPNFAWLAQKAKVSPEGFAMVKKYARVGIANVNNPLDVKEALDYGPDVLEV